MLLPAPPFSPTMAWDLSGVRWQEKPRRRAVSAIETHGDVSQLGRNRSQPIQSLKQKERPPATVMVRQGAVGGRDYCANMGSGISSAPDLISSADRAGPSRALRACRRSGTGCRPRPLVLEADDRHAALGQAHGERDLEFSPASMASTAERIALSTRLRVPRKPSARALRGQRLTSTAEKAHEILFRPRGFEDAEITAGRGREDHASEPARLRSLPPVSLARTGSAKGFFTAPPQRTHPPRYRGSTERAPMA